MSRKEDVQGVRGVLQLQLHQEDRLQQLHTEGCRHRRSGQSSDGTDLRLGDISSTASGREWTCVLHHVWIRLPVSFFCLLLWLLLPLYFPASYTSPGSGACLTFSNDLLIHHLHSFSARLAQCGLRTLLTPETHAHTPETMNEDAAGAAVPNQSWVGFCCFWWNPVRTQLVPFILPSSVEDAGLPEDTSILITPPMFSRDWHQSVCPEHLLVPLPTSRPCIFTSR